MRKNKLSGFTLIELLIVIAIIAILTILIVGVFRSTQIKARDAARKADLKEMANSLEQFYSDYQRYPDSLSGSLVACKYESIPANSGTCAWGSVENPFEDYKGTVYMRTLPRDPSGFEYVYRVLNSNQSFQLFAHLENTEDQDCMMDVTRTEPNCESPDLGTLGVNCGEDCNFSITSPNTSPYDL